MSRTRGQHVDGRPRGLLMTIIGALLVLLAFLTLLPPVMSWASSIQASQGSIKRILSSSQTAEDRRILQQARKYNQNLTPWNADQNRAAADSTYQSLLSTPGDTTLAVIRIPKIGVTLPVRHGADKSSLSTGAGHLYGTPLPIPGGTTASVIAAHRGYGTHRMFLEVDRLKKGDTILIDVAGTTETWTVTGSRIIQPNNTQWITRRAPNTLTLLTCTPVGLNTSRLLIQARLQGVKTRTRSNTLITGAGPENIPAGIILIAGLITFTLMLRFTRRRGANRK